MTPPLPRSISVQRYKAFRQRATLELRPLTLLYGYNNTGKSALVRVLRALSESVQPGLPPGLYTGGVLRDASFQDLLHAGLSDDEPNSFELELGWEPGQGELSTLSFAFIESPDYPGRAIPGEISCSLQSGQSYVLKLAGVPSEEVYTYHVHTNAGAGSPCLLTWEGISPCPLPVPLGLTPSPQDALLLQIQRALSPLRAGISWLRAVREAPPRFSPLPPRRERSLNPRGDNAPLLLEAQPHLQERCAAFLYEHLQRRLLTERQLGPMGPVVSTYLGPERERLIPHKVHLVDSGEGPVHLLPVLVALEQVAASADESPLWALLIEEPEAHIHPHLQRRLAEHLSRIAAPLQERRIILETHSEHILLGVQLQIAQGNLDPTQVALCWVGARADGSSEALPVTLHTDGSPSGLWPDDVFADDDQVVRELLRARRAQRPRHP